MDIRPEIGCSLDVHKDSVTAFLQRLEPGGQVTKTLRTFGTMPPDVLTLRE
jgi:hypothetical protein